MHEPIKIPTAAIEGGGPALWQFIRPLYLRGDLICHEIDRSEYQHHLRLEGGDEGRLNFKLLNLLSTERLAHALATAGLIQVVNDEGRPHPNFTRLARDLGIGISAAIEYNEGKMPYVTRMVYGPAFNRINNRWVRAPIGLDLVNRSLVLPPLDPKLGEADPTYPHLKALFSGLLPFSQYDVGNLAGAVVAAFARTGIAQFPLLFLESKRKSSGKSCTVEALLHLLGGERSKTHVMNYDAGDEGEVSRAVAKYAGVAGPVFMCIDNVELRKGRGFKSSALSTVTAAHSVNIRKMQTGMTVINDPVIFITMNNARIENDLCDKSLVMSLTRPADEHHRMIRPYPPDYVAQHRLALIAEALHILENMDLSTAPPAEFRMYDFDATASLAARALGLPCCLNPMRLKTCDQGLAELANLLHDAFPGQDRVTIRDLMQKIQAEPSLSELNDIIASANRAREGRIVHFTEWLADQRVSFAWNNTLLTLRVEGDTLVVSKETK